MYPHTKQSGVKDCASASLQMIIKYYNGYVSIDDLNELLHTTKNGTTAFNIIEVAKKLGFNARGVRAPLKEMSEVNTIYPFIIYVVIDDKYKHFMVVYKINFKKKYLIVGDPATKVRKITFFELEKIYSDVAIFLYPVKPIIKNNEVSLKKLILNIIKKYHKELSHLFFISFIYMILSVGTSFYLKILFDNIDDHSYIDLIFWAFLSFNLFKIISDYLRNKLLIFINEKIDLELNMDAINKVINLPYHYYRNRTTGEVVTKIMDLDKVRNIINKVILIMFLDVPLTLVSALILIIISYKLFFISLLFLILYVIIIFLCKRIIASKTENVYQNKSEVASFLEESISGFETVKNLNVEDKIIKRYENRYVRYLKALINMDNFLNIQIHLKELVSITSELILFFIGVKLVSNNSLSVGSLLAFNSILVFFHAPVRNIVDLDVSLIEAKRVLKKVYEMFSSREEKTFKIENLDDISINNLSLNLNESIILKNINLNIKKGEKILLLGKSGSGKSTLLKILMGYLKVKRDVIKLDNLDINDVSNLKEKITYISQNETLFTDTLINNIGIYDSDDVRNVIKMCYVDEIIKNNDLGYNMVIEENGFNISGGEKQRIVLARALLKNSDVILIDEGLSQVDIELERMILKNIFTYYKDKTFIFVSHRDNNHDLFSKIIKLEDGVLLNG